MVRTSYMILIVPENSRKSQTAVPVL